MTRAVKYYFTTYSFFHKFLNFSHGNLKAIPLENHANFMLVGRYQTHFLTGKKKRMREMKKKQQSSKELCIAL